MLIHSCFDPATFTLTYRVYEPDSRDAVLIDPVLDSDPLSSHTSLSSVERVSAFLLQQGLRLHYVLDTHAHADHLSGAQYFKRQLGAGVVIGERITEVQAAFKQIFDLPADFATNGSLFDRLLADGGVLEAGALRIEAIATPGHISACLTYKIRDALFTGDALFIEDYGTGRCDFPRGSAEELYDSVHGKLYKLPDATRGFVGHDYQPGARALRYETTIGDSKRNNIQLRIGTPRSSLLPTARAATRPSRPRGSCFPAFR